MSTSLMTSRRFAPLFWCQFFSAFADNFLKNVLVFMILFQTAGPNSEALITLAGAVFIAPFFFLSGLGGQLADRFDKALVARRLKLAEIGVTALASAGYALHSVPGMFAALFLFGVIAALFGPIKYGILPDHLARAELPSGNALVEGATFLAILLGTIAGGMASRGGGPVLFGALIVAFSLMCWGAALMIPNTGEAAPALRIDKNIIRSTGSLLKALWSDRRLRWGGVVVSWFWLAGAVTLSLLPPLVKTVLGGDESLVTAYLAVFAIAIALGSRLASWLARGRIILYPTVIGAVLLGLFALDLGWAALGAPRAAASVSFGTALLAGLGLRTAIDLFGLAAAGGLFIVPSFTAVQAWAGADQRARVVAAVNVLNAAFMVAGGLGVALLQNFGLDTPRLFLMMGAACLLAALAIGATMPSRAFRENGEAQRQKGAVPSLGEEAGRGGADDPGGDPCCWQEPRPPDER